MTSEGKLLLPGDVAPWFRATALDGNPRYVFQSVGGRWIVLLLAGSAAWELSRQALALIAERRALFDDLNACFFGVSIDPTDGPEARIAQQLPGIRWFIDSDRSVSGHFGATDGKGYRPHWVLIDPMLRVVRTAPLDRGAALLDDLASRIAGESQDNQAPVLIVPRVFEPELCRHLIDRYRTHGGTDSGFMVEQDGQTVLRVDHGHKRRSDHTIEDQALVDQLRGRLQRFLGPMIERALQFTPTRIERFIIACYDGDEGGGHFRPHRDNTTRGTAHRRFAVTLNLNADDYDGGDLRFPEFGSRTYRAPTGGAVVFSCSLLHEATPVARGQRYAFLPFLYDDAGAKLREANARYLADASSPYRAEFMAAADHAPVAR